MSIILDALKKAEKDRSKSNQPEGNSAPADFNPIINDEKKKSVPLVYILISVLFVGVIFLGISWYSKFSKEQPKVSGAKPKTFSTPVKATPVEDADSLREQALALFSENKLEQSQEMWEKLLELLPSDSEAYNNLGLVLKKLGKTNEADRAYRKALEFKPGYPEALNNLGALLMKSPVNSQEAYSLLKKAASLEPVYPDPHFHLALLLEKQKNYNEAVLHYEKFLNLAKNLSSEHKARIEMRITILKLGPDR